MLNFQKLSTPCDSLNKPNFILSFPFHDVKFFDCWKSFLWVRACICHDCSIVLLYPNLISFSLFLLFGKLKISFISSTIHKHFERMSNNFRLKVDFKFWGLKFSVWRKKSLMRLWREIIWINILTSYINFLLKQFSCISSRRFRL